MYTLITGGAGFLGANLAHRLLTLGESVALLDNGSRRGAELNLLWLRQNHRVGVKFVRGDVRDRRAVRDAVQQASSIFHLAAQTSVSSAAIDPRRDFEINAVGTLNVLEEAWRAQVRPPLVFASTAKVYGALEPSALSETETRYEPLQYRAAQRGIPETWPVNPSTATGCSRLAAESYVLHFARSYGMNAVALRFGTVYGPQQFGDEEQGWVSHFVRSTLEEQRLEITGNGKQVRDVLFVDDAVDALVGARGRIAALKGRVFNIGGGPAASVSLLELIGHLRDLHGHAPSVVHTGERPGDARYYVSDISAFSAAAEWAPKVAVRQGLRETYTWVSEYEGIPGGFGLLRTSV